MLTLARGTASPDEEFDTLNDALNHRPLQNGSKLISA
jgi:hypothetical protein